jgi:type III pantothenate kinase
MLLIDIGNSRIKAGVLERGRIHLQKPCEWRTAAAGGPWHALLGGLIRPTRLLVSNVAGNAMADTLTAWAQDRWQLVPEFVTVQREFAGMTTRYDRPAQLGIDRWLAALAGFHLAKGAVCVIDSGTALTVDIVNAAGDHLGGLITPGLGLMARSLTQGTAQLSLDAVHRVDHIATNTAAAISLGCREAVAGLILRVAERVRRELEQEPLWVVTGGEAEMIRELSPVVLRVVPDLVLQGIAIAGAHPT